MTIGNLDKLTSLGPDWCKALIQKTGNTFWKQVFKYWKEFSSKQTLLSNSDIMQSPLWFNLQISEQNLYLSTWKAKGICIVGDIVNKDGNILAIEELKNKYQLRNIEFDYYLVRSLVRSFIKKV